MAKKNLEKFVSALQFILVATLILRLFFAYEWLNAGIGKIQSIMTDSSQYFAVMKNVISTTWTEGAKPNPFPFMVSFLKDVVAPNIEFFITLVAIGEFFVGLSYLFGFLVRPAAIFGMIMNLTYFLASGHTSPSTAGINIIMFGGQLFFLLVSAGRAYGLDALLHKKFPKLNLF
ncbi:MAG: DoxX family membrane protein [Candidatus Aenigmarchaeota archaeon]|nr:DoxX family membrane protein [Candidatus Aenigmarchaeota archaeon]